MLQIGHRQLVEKHNHGALVVVVVVYLCSVYILSLSFDLCLNSLSPSRTHTNTLSLVCFFLLLSNGKMQTADNMRI